ADWVDSVWPRERIGFYEGQASAFYNVSGIERDYFEMWYFDNLGAYKGAAHGAQGFVQNGHGRMQRALKDIREKAAELKALGEAERREDKRFDPSSLWLKGDYTDFNRERN
ncbi:MAG: hydroxylamine oxidoreductase, partial [Alphaproteobacteria bacterium]|nr:hydroxylamine oxidoreductase [Alphaproteobacteria bacterium]